MSGYEILTSPNEGMNLFTGEEFDAIEIKYRKPPTRKWTRVNVILEEDGPSADEVIALAEEIVLHHAEERAA